MTEDKYGGLTVFDLIFPSESIVWNKIEHEIPNYGFSESTYWFSMRIENDTLRHVDKLLEIGYPLLDIIDVYINTTKSQNNALALRPILLGDTQPFSERPVEHRNFLIPVALEPGEQLHLIIRVQGSSSIQLPLLLWEERSFWTDDQAVLLFQGIYFGVMFIMMIYNFLLFISMGDRNYLYYVITVFFVVLNQASVRGYTFQYLWPESPLIQELSMPLLVSWGTASVAVFSVSFMEMRTRSPLLFYVIVILLVSLILNGFAVPLLSYNVSIRIGIMLSVLYAIFVFTAGIGISFRGYKPAAYFLLAYTMMLTGTLVLALSKLGYIPRNFFTENGQGIGSLLEVTLLAFALVYRITLLKEGKEEAERKTKANLESEVLERTRDLHEAMGQLERVNHQLSRQSREDGLTRALNRRAFDEMLHVEWNRAQRARSPIALIVGDIDFFKSINEVYGHLSGDDCLRFVSATLQSVLNRPGDNVFRFGGEEFAILLPDTDLEGALLVAERMRQSISRQNLDLDGNQKQVTMSFGVASAVPTHATTAESLIFGADQAVFRAKEKGRNCVEPTYSIDEPSF